MTENVNCINMSLSKSDVDYRIHKFESYTDNFDLIIKGDSKKIYVLDVDTESLSGLEIASIIRKYDYDSIIIIVSSINKSMNDIFYNRLMILDFICVNGDYTKRLIEDIKIAISIIDKHKVFTFKYNRIVNRIPFCQINYIEKESNIKRCIIHTINGNYYITSSITSILSLLDENFCKTHQACIVNLDNIRKLDLKNNMIIFKNDDMTDMLTYKMKKEVKKCIGI